MDRLLDGLTEDQRRAVTTPAQTLRIVAGAGSGKTRVLTRRIAHRSRSKALDPSHTLALTFTRKAAGELRNRLYGVGLRDGVPAGTFHARAWAQLTARWADQGQRPPSLLERRISMLGRLAPDGVNRNQLYGIATEIDWARARRITPEQYPDAAKAAGRTAPVGRGHVATLMTKYATEKKRRSVVDFDDLLELCIDDLNDDSYAAAVHWRFRHLFVDEFQDVNPLQFALLKAWMGPETTLCVVGDPRQAIYGWNGADPDLLNRFAELFPGSETVRLDTNFRSTPQILRTAHYVLPDAEQLAPTRPNGPPPMVFGCADQEGEQRRVARAVRDNHPPGGRWSDQAVLVRTNAQVAPIVDAMSASGIPTSIRESVNILELPRVQRILDEIKHGAPLLSTAIQELRLEPTETDEKETVRALELLIEQAQNHLSLDPTATTDSFLEWLRAAAVPADYQRRDAVSVLTFHAAKGLEWPSVHLAGLEEGLVPISWARSEAAQQEERRLLYVAITRAQRQLFCTWSAERTVGKTVRNREPSRFLQGLEHARAVEPPEPDATEQLRHVRAIRAELDAVLDPLPRPDRLLNSLRSWRTTVASAASVPAYVVFSDKTLDAIVDALPQSEQELSQISGVGPVKLARYGTDLLDLVQQSGDTLIDLRESTPK